MAITQDQKRVIDSILSLFETGSLPDGKAYGRIAILADGAGISYGKHQSTDRANSLDKVISLYLSRKSNQRLSELYNKLVVTNHTTKFSSINSADSETKELVNLLSSLGSDIEMQKAQDEVFDRDYWNPAMLQFEDAGCNLAISALALYDTAIQSGPGRIKTIRNMFPAKSPKNGGDEIVWVKAYIDARSRYLLSSSNSLVRASSYRTAEMKKIAESQNWNLQPPLIVRGIKIR